MKPSDQFIKISILIEQKPNFLLLAERVGRNAARGICLGVWLHADIHGIQMEDGTLLPASKYRKGYLDLACGEKVEEHMEAVEWLEHRDDGIFLPGFNCCESRRRSHADRIAEWRKKKKGEQAENSTDQADPHHQPAEPPATTTEKKAKPKPPPGDFDAWWEVHPRKEGKGHAAKAYAKAIAEGADPGVLLMAIREQAQRWKDEGKEHKYIKHPATWLNAKCWEDAPPPEEPVQDLTQEERDADPLNVPDEIKTADWWKSVDPDMTDRQAAAAEKDDTARYWAELREYRKQNRRPTK